MLSLIHIFVSDLKVKADGSYDFDSARPVVLTADGQAEMFTDEKGYARDVYKRQLL